VFELLEAAEQRWRSVNGPQLVALVRLGARFEEEIPNDQERGQCGRHPWLVFPQDQKLFRWFLKEQDRRQITGDLAELGVYMGKGAVVGEYLRPGETFTLIDLFESLASDSDN
jgi:hypothetical protein